MPRSDKRWSRACKQRIAVVTGGGSGIGRAIALGYAKEGAHVAVLDVNGDAATETAKAITEAGGKAGAS
jgi:3-oxoacyl-[acyl-carrier protein] reductase